MVLSSMTVNGAGDTPPKLTDVVPVSSVPVKVTLVPPACGPLAGAIALTRGTGAV